MKFTLYLSTLLVLGLGVGLSVSEAVAQQATPGTVVIEDCNILGERRSVKCATMQVPLDHGGAAAGTIEIGAVIMPARSGKPEADPLLIFAGGPGQAASELSRIVKAGFADVWQDRDVLLIDQRGTGRSTPLDCPFDPEDLTAESQRNAMAACHSEIEVDSRFFHLENSVHDMALFIRALGYNQVNTYGASYGTRTSAHFYRRYPEMVRSIIIDAVAPPDTNLFEAAPQAAEFALQSLIEDCSAAPACVAAYPDLRGAVNSFVEAARAGKLRYTENNPLTGDAMDMPVNEIAAVESIRSVLYAAPQTVMLPHSIHEAGQGNLKPIFAQSFSEAGLGRLYMGMTLSFLCSEEISRTPASQAENWGQGSYARDTFYRNFANLCPVWPHLTYSDLPADMFEPWAGDVPTLIISGTLDPITPPEGGAHVAKTLPNSKHIVVNGTGHGGATVSCMPYLMDQFIKNPVPGDLDESCLSHVKRSVLMVGPNGQTLLPADDSE